MSKMAGRDTEEFSRMIQGKKTGEIQISEIEKLLEKEDIFAKCTAVQAVARIGGREAYGRLIDVIRDESEVDVINAAIIAMAQTRIAPDTADSRALFPLVNIYNITGHYQTKINILNALAELNDPRAMDFLKQLKEIETKDLQEIIDGSVKAQAFSKRFAYTFTDADTPDLRKIEETRQKAMLEEKKRIPILHYSDVSVLPIHFRDIRLTGKELLGPLTYIIDKEGKLFIGGDNEEHVQTARGENVIAAGEITLAQNGDAWDVIELNNRSNGYFPAKTTFPIIAEILDRAGIRRPEQFTYIHPREGFFSDDFLSMFPFHPKYEEKHFSRKKKKTSWISALQ